MFFQSIGTLPYRNIDFILGSTTRRKNRLSFESILNDLERIPDS